MEIRRKVRHMKPLPDPTNGQISVVHISQTLTVSPSSTSNVPLVLNAADKVQGKFRILRAYGYGDRELKFRVLDKTETPQHSQPVLDLGTVANHASFDFTVAKSGNYVLVFDNQPSSSSSNSQKEVQLTYEITKPTVTSRQDATPIA